VWRLEGLRVPLLVRDHSLGTTAVDVCNELATNFTIHDAIKILSKLSVE